jgi:hypothetical protein
MTIVTRLTLSVIMLSVAASPALANERNQHNTRVQSLVSQLRKQRQVRTAHPQVAKRLSQEVSKSLGRAVTIKPEQIIQVEFDSHAHKQLRNVLHQSVGVGIYPSRLWGHNKLRAGSEAADSVPGNSRAFPSTGTKARVVGFGKMHKRFYEAVFTATPTEVKTTSAAAHRASGKYAQKGTNCASFVCEILRDAGSKQQGYFDGKLSSLVRGGSAGSLWNNAVGAKPDYIIVYTPKGDFRSVEKPAFVFDYKE